MTKTCKTCQILKPVSDFTVTDKVRGYYYPHCKLCQAAKKKAKRQSDPATYNAYQRSYYEKNKEKLLPRARKANAKAYRNMKAEILSLLGGKCAVCGITQFLQVDHVQGNGGEHRGRTPNNHTTSLRDIRNAARADEAEGKYQLLCANHHYEKTLTEISC